MPNFMWQRHLTDARHHVQLTLEQIGTTLLARRYHMGLDQDEVARRAGTLIEETLTQIEISNLENGILPARMRDESPRLRAVFQALEFNDVDEYVAMIVDLDRHRG